MSDWIWPTAFSVEGEEERDAWKRVFASKQYTMGPECEAFEQELAAFHGRKHCIAVNSGSSANLVMVAAATPGVRHMAGSRPIALVPAIAWATSYAPFKQHGFGFLMADVDATWNGASDRWWANADFAGAVLGCSILGNPAFLQEIDDLCARTRAVFLNDDCESLGARIGDRTTGSFGWMAANSFFWSHQVSAVELGAVLTDDDECNRLCRMLRAHGWTRDVAPPTCFDDSYRFELFGYNVRPIELHCAIARAQLAKLPRFIANRRENLEYFWHCAAEKRLPLTRQKPNGQQSPFGIAFTVESREIRAKLVEALRKNGIDARLPTGGSFTRHPYGAPWRNQPTPNADKIHDCGLFLGLPPWDAQEQVGWVASTMRAIL
jgi:CDP-6-deoxy-D-xylo-4-hexulose-3-dehydrase